MRAKWGLMHQSVGKGMERGPARSHERPHGQARADTHASPSETALTALRKRPMEPSAAKPVTPPLQAPQSMGRDAAQLTASECASAPMHGCHLSAPLASSQIPGRLPPARADPRYSTFWPHRGRHPHATAPRRHPPRPCAGIMAPTLQPSIERPSLPAVTRHRGQRRRAGTPRQAPKVL